LAVYEQAARQKGIQLTEEIEDSLELNTDQHLLAIVLRNLVDNALKNTDAGSIRLLALASNGSVRLCVKDTGKGMSPEKLAFLTTTETGVLLKGGGHFFGYRFVRDFISRLGGTFSIESQQGVGTTVTIILSTG
jgi:signal transduction histidine kinase